jgi:hypothetical protein
MFPGMLSAVSRRGPLTALVLTAAVVLPDDLGLSSFHIEGVSMIRATTSLNASVTPSAVLADASTNRQPVRAANAAPSDVGTC